MLKVKEIVAEWGIFGKIARISREKWFPKGKNVLKMVNSKQRKVSKKGIDKKYSKDYIRSIVISTQSKRVLTSQNLTGRTGDMELDERKITILKAIIKNYMETGEPVGSRTISKYVNSKWSSATIRNEMSDLEEMGYIVQPHTSAGRIPSDKGYRFYVDQILLEKDNEVTEIKEMMVQRMGRLEQVLKALAKNLASNTNYAAMISGPQYHRNKLKFIQLSKVDTHKLLIVTVVEGNIIKNTMVNIEEAISDEELLNLNILLNTNLNGLTIEEINLGVISRLKEQAGIHSKVVDLVLNEVAAVIKADEDELQIYTSGATNIFKYPELSDSRKASELLSTLEHTETLQELVDTVGADSETGIQVYIGDESPVQAMKDCSVVTATYELGEGLKGTIGIIGPKRMDYEKVLKTLRNLITQLDATFKKEDER
jgi:heat-inducible transcriptional repressor